MKTSLKLLLLCALFVLAPMARAQDTFTINVGDCVSEGRIFPNGTAGGCDAALPNTPTAGAGSLEAAGATDTYSFAANAGDFVFVEPRLYAGNGQPVNWRVVAPSGAVLFNQQLQPQRGSAPPRFDLTETGTYQIIVGEGSGFVGGYQFALWNVPAPATIPLTIDIGIDGNFPAPGMVNTYTFDGTAGQYVYFQSFGACCDAFIEQITYRLEAPSGQVLVGGRVRPDQADIPTDEFGYPIIDPQGSTVGILPETGTYRIIIGSPANPYAGTFGFAVNTLAPELFSIGLPEIISLGFPANGAGALFGNNFFDIFGFAGTAGQTLSLRPVNLTTTNESAFFYTRWSLVSPSGQVLFNRPLFEDVRLGNFQTITLPETGFYFLNVFSLRFVDVVYGVQITDPQGTGVLPFRRYPIGFDAPSLTVPASEGLLQGTGGNTPTLVRDGFAGNVTINPDGSFTYTPGPSYIIYDEFLYRVELPSGSVFGTVAVAVDKNVVGDAYFLDNAMEPLVVSAAEGVLVNDFGVTNAEYVPVPFADGITYPRNGTLDLRPDGSFTYTPNANFNGADTFFYRDANNPNRGTAGVGISIGLPIVVRVPPPQFTPINTALDIPGVSVETAQDLVTLDLSVANGVLNVDAFGGIVAQADPPPAVTGNGSGNVTLTGTRDAINAALENLVYTPNNGFRGVDELVVVGTVTGGSDTKTVIITVGEDGEVTREIRTAPLDLSRDFLLSVISEQPDTNIRGTVPAGAVPGGDVYVRVLADTGEVLVPVAELGDTSLIELGILNSAEVFGLSAGGATVPTFAQSVEVCLRGSGGFYYRDATGMPRGTQQMTTRSSGGFTCTDIPNSGTVILVRDGVMLAEEVSDSVLLDGCMVTTRNILNLREGPSTADSILRPIPFNVTLTALERQGNWFYVDYLGLFGWVSGDFLTLEGSCG